MSSRSLSVLSLVAALSCVAPAAAKKPARRNAPAAGGVRKIELTGRKGGVQGGIPFQSHNQKVVQNDNGIFITHGRREAPTGFQLQRSTDGGKTFKTVYAEQIPVNAPTLDTDADSNLYLLFPDSAKRKTRFLKFAASNGYTAPVISKAYGQASSFGKFASAYDAPRERLYHGTQSGHLLTMDESGKLLRSQRVFTSSSTGSGPGYPHLFVDEFGVIHYAMTAHDGDDPKLPNDGKDDIPYETIRYLKSVDGGKSWRAMDGKPVRTPTTCAPGGPSTMINLPDEIVYKTWLGCMCAKNGKVHFTYLTLNPKSPEKAGNPPKIKERHHYMRFDATTGVREIDSWSDWKKWGGKSLHIHTVGGLLVSYPSDPMGPLFAVGGQGRDGMNKGARKLAVLVSYDNGSTWADYAVSGDLGLVWAESGSRAVTRDGKVIGTLATAKPQWATTQFFQFDARPALLGQGFGKVRLPCPSELKGHVKTAWISMGCGQYGPAAAALKGILGAPDRSDTTEFETASVIMQMAECRAAASVKRLGNLEKIGDYYTLSRQMVAAKPMLSGLPSFDESYDRWQKEKATEKWRDGIRAGQEYNGLLLGAARTTTPEIIKRLQDFAARQGDSLYGRAALNAIDTLKANPKASPSTIREAYFKNLMK